jgi:prepilin-type N-terminal cleavage/methylation domain-containing protein
MREVHAIAPPPGETAPQSALSAGFTLIEISIVLVIIGLVAGGILTGQELIFQAQIRGTVSAMDKYKQAYHAFVTKYNCVPGDCANASSFGFGGVYNGSPNGDGDGYIYSYSDSNQSLERVETWGALIELSQAGMIQDYFPTEPQATSNIPIANGFMYFTSLRPTYSPPTGYVWPTRDTNYLYLASYPQNGADFSVTAAVLTSAQAWAIDLKIDDGLPMSGNVVATWQFQHGCGSGNATINGPCYNAPTLYSGHSNSACVDDRVTPAIYMGSNWTSGKYSNCSIDVPVD